MKNIDYFFHDFGIKTNSERPANKINEVIIYFAIMLQINFYSELIMFIFKPRKRKKKVK